MVTLNRNRNAIGSLTNEKCYTVFCRISSEKYRFQCKKCGDLDDLNCLLPFLQMLVRHDDDAMLIKSHRSVTLPATCTIPLELFFGHQIL